MFKSKSFVMCKIEHLIKKILEAEGVIDNPIKYSLSYSGK